MRRWTYEEIKTKVERDLDHQEETMISEEEMLGYCNEAIDACEAEIHGIYEDYFLTSSPLALVSGTSSYELPADIYASKIRSVIYSNSGNIYEIKRIRTPKKFLELAHITQSNPTNHYNYIITNAEATGPRLVLYPSSKETSSTNVTIWYLRNAARMVELDDECDIPEFTSFVLQYMKVKCYEKEAGHPMYQTAVLELMALKKQMIETLTEMVPDEDNEVIQDLSHYEEMS